MKCPECQFENRETAKFCNECGHRFELRCPECGTDNQPGSKFCNECGQDLTEGKKASSTGHPESRSPVSTPSPDESLIGPGAPEGERKYVTALFSDMSGYTAMSDRLDPEEVKEITGRIFGEVSRVVKRYDGFIEKFIGDAVMALFGVPMAHEDDPVRAIRAAREIHDLVQAISPQVEERVGKPLSMHTGINTGLVVTGEVNLERGTHGVTGDTLNVAARLSGVAKADEIVVGPDTFHQAEAYFVLEAMEPTKVKGKAEPIQVYRVVSPKEQPGTTRRHSGLRADLIGRGAELSLLKEAALGLEGRGGRSSPSAVRRAPGRPGSWRS